MVVNYIMGMFKYMFKGPFTNPISMYIYGGGIIALLKTLPHIISGDFLTAFITYLLQQLPPTSIENIIFNIVVGSVVAGLKWFIMSVRTPVFPF